MMVSHALHEPRVSEQRSAACVTTSCLTNVCIPSHSLSVCAGQLTCSSSCNESRSDFLSLPDISRAHQLRFCSKSRRIDSYQGTRVSLRSCGTTQQAAGTQGSALALNAHSVQTLSSDQVSWSLQPVQLCAEAAASSLTTVTRFSQQTPHCIH